MLIIIAGAIGYAFVYPAGDWGTAGGVFGRRPVPIVLVYANVALFVLTRSRGVCSD